MSLLSDLSKLDMASRQYARRQAGRGNEIPPGMSWLTDTISGFDIYKYGFVLNPTIYYDPTATTSRNIGTYQNPINNAADLMKRVKGDMSGHRLGVKRGTMSRLSALGQNGLLLNCYGSASDPFMILPYGDAEALPVWSGGQVRTDWTVDAGNVYKLSISLPWITAIASTNHDTDVFQNEVRLQKVNGRAAVDGPGKIAFVAGTTAGGTLYMWPYNNENPNLGQVEVQMCDYGLNFMYSDVAASGGVRMIGMDVTKIRNIAGRMVPVTGAASIASITGLYAVGNRFRQNGFDSVTQSNASDGLLIYGLNDAVRATDVYIAANESYDTMNNAYEIGAIGGMVMEYNYGHDVGGNSICELWFSCSNCMLRHNVGRNSSAQNRLFKNYHQGGIWSTVYNVVTVGGSMSHSAFQNNTFEFNVIADAVGQGIDIYGGTGHIVRHNTMYNAATTPTNRLLSLGTNAAAAGTMSVEYSNNVIMGSTAAGGNNIAADIMQGTANNDAGVSISATITGDNNWYMSSTSAELILRVNRSNKSYSAFAAWQTAVGAGFDVHSQAKDPSASPNLAGSKFLGSDYRPVAGSAIKTAGKMGFGYRRYADGYPYDSTSVAVGAYAA